MNTTIFLDIDGCLLEQGPVTAVNAAAWAEPKVLPGVIDRLLEWDRLGHRIILTTARRECFREYTVWQLRRAGIFYDQLVMGLGTGPRVLVNDQKPGQDTLMARAFALPRNVGIGGLEV